MIAYDPLWQETPQAEILGLHRLYNILYRSTASIIAGTKLLILFTVKVKAFGSSF
jgi:hypothetical protein